MKTIYKSTLLLTAAYIVLYLNFAFGQAPPAIEWQIAFDGSGFDNAGCIQQTNDGGFVITGLSNFEMLVTKLDTAGNIEWQKSLGGGAANSIKQTNDGGYIVAGASFSGNHGINGDFGIVKTDQTGNIQWQKSYGGSEFEQATSIDQTTDGNYIVAGQTRSSDGDVIGLHSDYDYWILKLDTSGAIIWQKSYGSTDIGGCQDIAYSIQETLDGQYLVVGESHGCLIWKLDTAGNIVWQKLIGGRNDVAGSIQQTDDGGYIFAGNKPLHDGDINDLNGYDYWVVKLDIAGNIQWEKTYGGTGNDFATSVQQTIDGEYIVAGTSNSNDGDVIGHHGSAGSPDCWVIKLNHSGVILWQKSLGGTDGDGACNVIQTTDGAYVIGASTTSNDGDLTGNHDSGDYWIIKLAKECTLPTTPTSIFSLGGTPKVGPGDSRTYITKADTGVTFFWAVPTGASITSGQGTRSIHVTYHHNFACSGEISVAKVNSCGKGEPRNLTVYKKAPNIPSKITGASFGLCGKQNVVYSVQSVSGVTYNWTVPAVANIMSGQGTNSITVNFQTAGFIKIISVTASNCGTSLPRILLISSAPATPANIYGNTTVCSNSNGNAFWIAPVTSATDYTWRAPFGSHITANGITSLNNVLTTTSNTVTVNFGTVTFLSTISVRANNTCGNSGTRILLLSPCSQRAEDLSSNPDVKVYPNPSGGIFTLTITSSANNHYTILVYDVLGKELMKENLSVHEGLTEHQMDLQQLNPGLYFLTVLSTEGKQVIKITKE